MPRTFMSVRRMDGSEASAVPIAFLSAQRDPVGFINIGLYKAQQAGR